MEEKKVDNLELIKVMTRKAIKTVKGKKIYEAHQSSSEFANEEFKLKLYENKGELGENKGGTRC